MNKPSSTLTLSIAAVCVALCVVLPLAFHAIPNGGNIFSPMHIPVLLCGLVCGWPLGLACGLLGPALSSLLTGMPPQAFLPPMMVELAVYGLMTGLLMRLVRTGKSYPDVVISLVVAMVLGRVVAGLARAWLFAPGQLSMAMWASSYFVKSLPGIVIHLLLIPVILMALWKARLIPARYPNQA